MIKKGHDIYQGTLDDLVVAHKNKSLEDIFIEMTHEEYSAYEEFFVFDQSDGKGYRDDDAGHRRKSEGI